MRWCRIFVERIFPILLLTGFTFCAGCTSKSNPSADTSAQVPAQPAAVAKAEKPAANETAPLKPFEPDFKAAEAFFRQGVESFDAKDFEKAADLFSQAIQNYPRYAKAYCRRGDAYAALGQFAVALESYTRATVYDQKEVNAYLGRAAILEKQRDYYLAAMNYSNAIDLQQDNSAYYKMRAKAYFDAEEYLRALDDLTVVLRDNPQDCDALCLRGLAYEKIGDRATALADYSDAIAEHPDSPTAYYRRACARIAEWKDAENHSATVRSTKTLELAREDLDAAISREKNEKANAGAYRQRAVAYELLGQRQKAIDDLKRAVALNPKSAEDYRKIGDLLLADKNPNAALEAFNAALDINPQDAKAYYGRGMANLSDNFRADAIEDFTSAIRMDPKSAAAHRARGDAYLADSNIPSAINDYDETLRLNIADAAAYRQRARCYYLDKQYYKALTDCDDAVRLNPNDAIAHNVKGCVYLALEERDKAIDEFAAANEIDPQDAKVLNNLGVAYEAKNDLPSAIRCYDDALKIDADDSIGLHNRGVANLKFGGGYSVAKPIDGKIADPNRAKLEKAVADLKTVRGKNPQNANIHYELGMAFFLLDDYRSAEASFGESIGLNPKFANAYYYRSQTFQRLNQTTDAEADFKKWNDLK